MNAYTFDMHPTRLRQKRGTSWNLMICLIGFLMEEAKYNFMN